MTDAIVFIVSSIGMLVAGGILLGALVVISLPTIGAMGMDNREIEKSFPEKGYKPHDYDEDF